MWSCGFGKKQITIFGLKKQVIITKKALHIISRCVREADNNFETGGVLIGCHLGEKIFVVAATTPNTGENRSKVSFLLNGENHTQKANEIVKSKRVWSPSVLGVWHSHICDGHSFSQQDKMSNMALAKSFDGALSMLVTQSAHTVLFSASYISAEGIAEDCVIRFQKISGLEVKAYERK